HIDHAVAIGVVAAGSVAVVIGIVPAVIREPALQSAPRGIVPPVGIRIAAAVVIRAAIGEVAIVRGPKAVSEQAVIAVRIPKAANAQAPVVPVGIAEAEAK